MAPIDLRPIPEELLLLCAEPAGGRLRIPYSALYRAVAGGVVAELLVSGAITVEGRWITEVRPPGGQDEIAAGLLARLEKAGRRNRRVGLDTALRRIPRRSTLRLLLDRLAADGVITVETRRFLGLPYRRRTATRPGIGQEIAGRVAATLARGGDRSPAAERDRQLAGLVGAAGLHYRLYPGAKGAPTRRAVRRLVTELPIARAVRRARSADSAASSS
ncbi:GPP34 family phosphoprotein [Kitasatospora sp. NPDC091207]|uniref:GOLPH3/VPS74 family protein n=1 Tax=Kitasatospora sp. NPDC091207 TaxID=3364083 RepID=UPI003803483E